MGYEVKRCDVCSSETGEVLKTFEGIELIMGRQWWTAWCVGRFYTIDEIEQSGKGTTYWVH